MDHDEKVLGSTHMMMCIVYTLECADKILVTVRKINKYVLKRATYVVKKNSLNF